MNPSLRREWQTRLLWAFLWRWRKLALRANSMANYAAAAAWGVELGPGCKFYGRVSFERQLGSSIRIGSHCSFRSGHISNRIGINRPCMITTLSAKAKIIIGDNVGMSGTTIGADESIVLADEVRCGANVTITDSDWHGLQPDARRTRGPSAPVLIEENVWLGLNVVVLKGVTIGANTVVGAGSVVTRSLPANVIAGGLPAKVIRAL
jgi:acetyltransferase-like isoleucine patch superfamily enzyme